MQGINDWWIQLTFLTKFFYFFAVPSTVILIIQSILTIIGFGMDSDADMDMGMDTETDFDMDMSLDVDGDTDIGPTFDIDNDGVSDFEALGGAVDFRFVTFRGIIAFFTMFGWMGASLSTTDLMAPLIFLFALIAGLIGMFVIALLFYGISKLQSSGNISYRNAIGLEANVYIPIPEAGTGHGKVQLTLQERFIEVDAVTKEAALIGTGQRVLIVGLMNQSTVIVESKH